MIYNWKVRAAEYLKAIGSPRPRAYYRCGNCRSRRVLSKELWLYIQPPICKVCFKLDWRADISRSEDRRLKRHQYDTCSCDALWFPHRRGSVKECKTIA